MSDKISVSLELQLFAIKLTTLLFVKLRKFSNDVTTELMNLSNEQLFSCYQSSVVLWLSDPENRSSDVQEKFKTTTWVQFVCHI